MAQKRTIQRKDIEGLESGLSQVYGKPHERFFQHLVDYFTGWLTSNASFIAKGKVPQEQALLVVYSESPDLDFKRFADEDEEPIEVFATTHTLSDGMAFAVENLSKIFHAVPKFKNGGNDAMAFVRKHLGDDQVFALLMLGQDRMLVHEAGVPIKEWLQKQRVIPISQLSESLITPDLIDEQLDEFHAAQLAPAKGTTSRLMWEEDAETEELRLGPNPELHVQSALLTYFRGVYRKTVAFADEEVALSEGRVDIRIARADKIRGRAITMVELKVLNPRYPHAKNLQWAHKGIKQAHGYKKTPHTDAAFACIYDARFDKRDTMPTLAPDAKEKDVRLKVHPMDVPAPGTARKVGTKKASKPSTGKAVLKRTAKPSAVAKKTPLSSASGNAVRRATSTSKKA